MVSSNDVQRLFLQAILSRRVVSKNLAIKIWGKCVDAVKAADDSLEIPFSDSTESWDSWVTKINAALNPLDLEFAHSHHQETGKELYALVNRKGDEVAQMATDYSPVEIAYFKAVIEQIMLAPYESYSVSSLAALREAGALKSSTMSKSQAEVVLGSFVAKGWLTRSKNGRYSLSQRTIVELQSYLRSTYPEEVVECTNCFEMVTHGTRCNTPNCKVWLHEYCYTNYRRRKNTCPSCNSDWSSGSKTVTAIGEAAFKDGQDKGKRQVRRRESADEDSEGDDVQMDLEEEPSQPSQPSQSQKKGKGKKKAVREDSMDVDEEEQSASPPPQTQRRRKSRR